MRKITMENLADKIRKSIRLGEIITYYITDDPLRVHKDKKRKKRELLDVQEENKYDTVYAKLEESFSNSKKMVFWNTDGNGTYKGILVIDSTVMVEFNYCSLEGQAWLYKQYKNQ